MKCKNCGNDHDGSYGSGRFCSSKCAKGFSTKCKREEINKKVSDKMRHERSYCKTCGKELSLRNKIGYCDVCMYDSKEWKKIHKKQTDSLRGRPVKNRVKRSKNEILFYDMCKEHFNHVRHNKQIFNDWDADVIIEDIKVAILWNGKWHYEKITESHNLEQVQNRDKIKLKEIKSLGWTPYIIKDMGRYNPLFVKEKFEEFLGEIS